MDKCPMCGYSDTPQISQFSNVMSHYVNEKGSIIMFNSDEPELLLGKGLDKVKYRRQDLVEKELAHKKVEAARAQADLLSAKKPADVKAPVTATVAPQTK